jgi:hypothetical protein
VLSAAAGNAIVSEAMTILLPSSKRLKVRDERV